MKPTITAGVTAGVQANDFVVDGEYGGGWGAWTMGLLTPKDNVGKSFGMFGQQSRVAASGTAIVTPAYDP